MVSRAGSGKGAKRSNGKAAARPKKSPARQKRTAEQLASKQREISVSEFFEKNRHLLGFDNPLKALLTTVKEGVDNALDACEEAGVLPDVIVEITRKEDLKQFDATTPKYADGFTGEVVAAADLDTVRKTDGKRSAAAGSLFASLADEDLTEEEENALEEAAKRKPKGRGKGIAAPPEIFVIAIEDNGPGIVAAQVAKIFGKLLYGSKFHRLRQSRGQQGIGISAAGMYGQQTTGRPVRILSRTSKRAQAHYMEVALDVKRNQPDVRVDEKREWHKSRGTRVEIEMKARYQRGRRSVDDYLRATAMANPHVTLRYRDPDGRWTVYRRATKTLPPEPREVKPHPYGVELGMFLRMLGTSESQKVGAFLQSEFSRVSRKSAQEICKLSGANMTTWLSRVQGDDARELHAALSKVKLMNPPTDCISPIGEDLLIESLAREYPDAFLRAVTRPPTVYRGNPFQIEVALAYGKGLPAEGSATVWRFANRVPLLYQHGACAITKQVNSVPWKNYGIEQSRGGPPGGPLMLIVHLASVWVPFTSESKEAVAHYPEILKELRLAVMDCGRALGRHVRAEKKRADAIKKRDYIARYIPKIALALQNILEFDTKERDRTAATLRQVLDKSRNL